MKDVWIWAGRRTEVLICRNEFYHTKLRKTGLAEQGGCIYHTSASQGDIYVANVVIGTAEQCIYCSSKDGPLTREHVIAESLTGNLVIEKASCKTCADATSKLEFQVARNSFHLARAYYKLPTRRPKKYPKYAKVNLCFTKFGPKGPNKTINVPIEEAPIVIVAPSFKRAHEHDTENAFWSDYVSTALFVDKPDFEAKCRELERKHSVPQVSVTSLPFGIGTTLERVLWKSAYGFFWIVDSKSAETSDARDIIFEKRQPFDYFGEVWKMKNLYSLPRTNTFPTTASAAVFSKESEEHKFLHCELNFLGLLDLPIYYCAIPNVTGKEIARVDFRES